MPELTIQRCDLFLADLQTRMPFKYGIATMTRVPHIFVRAQIAIGTERAVGISADLLPPKWFTKDPDRAVVDEIADMLRVIRHAANVATNLKAADAFSLWQQLYRLQDDWGRSEKLPPLLAHFGSSLVERAMIEAVCRSAREPFHRLLREGKLGLRLDSIHPELRGQSPADLLPKEPLQQITARHTIGLVDPLRDEHIAENSRLDDGLPQSLMACIKHYRLRHFKIKVTGHLDHDLDRLQQIAQVFEQAAPADYGFSLDGNEQFHSLANFREYWSAVAQRADLKEFWKHLLFVEQPLHRDVALQPAVAEMLSDWTDHPPMIIDESDASLDSVPTALGLGYSGTSHKNCKGVFKGIANRCLLRFQELKTPASRRLMSGEDLATIGPVSLLQDLTVMATLGIGSVERNGHHYFAGLSMFSKEIQENILAAHSDLYQRSATGWPTLRITDGKIDVGTLHKQPFGVGFVVDVEKFIPADQYRPK